MSAFNLTIRLGNDAMQSGDDVAEALREVARTLSSRYDGLNLPDDNGPVWDLNGNRVGTWEVEA